MKSSEDIVKELEKSRVTPPPDFVNHVMGALPERPDRTWRKRFADMWPEGGKWLTPATAGALAALLVLVGLSLAIRRPPANPSIKVTFEVNAPDAEQVELVGSFNEWRTGEIVLTRQSADGPWTVTMDLPAGRHEYLFFVDGTRWITDPEALVCRPDGFGHRNAVLEI